MAEVLKIGDLTISSGDYGSFEHDFLEPRPELVMRAQAEKNGNILVKKRYPNVTRVITLRVSDSTMDEFEANLRAIQTELRKLDIGQPVTIEYTPNGSSTTYYSDIISGSRATPHDWFYVNRNEGRCTISLECEPSWRFLNKTEISQQTFSFTPAVLTASTVGGDIFAPCFIEIQSATTVPFGDDIYIGTRKEPMLETSFDPIKDFQGNTTDDTYNGQYARVSIGATTAYTNITGAAENINDISFPSTGVGWFVGDVGVIKRSSDYGATWNTQTSNTVQHLNSVYAASSSVVYAAGAGPIVLRSTDGGVTWTDITSTGVSGSGAVYHSVYALDDTTVWASLPASVQHSTDKGVSWTSANTNPSGLESHVHAASSSVVYVCTRDTIYKSTDGGDGFDLNFTSTDVNAFIFGIYANSSDSVVACGSRGNMYLTINGSTWGPLTSGVSDDLLDIEMDSTGIGWAVGESGTIVKSSDGTATWNTQTSNVASNLNGVSAINSSQAFTAGAANTILSTTDGGTTWGRSDAGTTWGLSSVTDYRGRYRVFARVRSAEADPTNVFVRAASGFAGGTVVENDEVAMTVATDVWEILDLGEIDIPITRTSGEISPTPIIQIDARGSGANNFDIDVAVLLPVDGEAAFIDGNATNAQFVTMDSSANAINKGFTKLDWNGSSPILRPGLRNNIVILSTNGIESVKVVMKYFERYLSPEQ